MHSVQQTATAEDAQKVLAVASAHGRRVELLENLETGKLVIVCNGNPEAVYSKGTSLESCVRTYMQILRHGVC